jgi:hypothetical protein
VYGRIYTFTDEMSEPLIAKANTAIHSSLARVRYEIPGPATQSFKARARFFFLRLSVISNMKIPSLFDLILVFVSRILVEFIRQASPITVFETARSLSIPENWGKLLTLDTFGTKTRIKSKSEGIFIDSDRAVSNTVMGDACLINSTRILDKQTRTWEFAVKAQATLSILCSIHLIRQASPITVFETARSLSIPENWGKLLTLDTFGT